MKENKLGFVDLLANGVGMCVGSGIMVLIGAAMMFTGRSAWLCFGLAIIYGAFMNLPYFFMSRSMVVEGGQYAIAYEFTGRPFGGMFMMLQFVTSLGSSLMGVAIGTYVNSVFPAVNANVLALIILTFFFITNLMGVKSAAIVQKIMCYVLLAAIVMMIVMGFVHGIDPAIFDVKDPEFMTGGGMGFLRSVMMMSFSCWGYYCLTNFSKDAINPKKNVPKAMLCTIPFLFVLYVGVAIVNCGVVPLEVAKGQVLTVAAQAIMPPAMVYIFLICGAVMALTTTLNSNMTNCALVIGNGVRDGWLPKGLAAENKKGAPKWILTILYLVSVVPILFNLSIADFVNNLILITALLQIFCAVGICKAYKRFDGRFNVKKPVFIVGMFLSFLTLGGLIVYAFLTLAKMALIVNLVYIGISVVYAVIRAKSDKVKDIKVNYYFDVPGDADEVKA